VHDVQGERMADEEGVRKMDGRKTKRVKRVKMVACPQCHGALQCFCPACKKRAVENHSTSRCPVCVDNGLVTVEANARYMSYVLRYGGLTEKAMDDWTYERDTGVARGERT